jgi:hypothetical protein
MPAGISRSARNDTNEAWLTGLAFGVLLAQQSQGKKIVLGFFKNFV